MQIVRRVVIFAMMALLSSPAAAADEKDFALTRGEWAFFNDDGTQAGTITFTEVKGDKVTGQFKASDGGTAAITGELDGCKLVMKIGKKDAAVLYFVETYPAIKALGSRSQAGGGNVGFFLQRRFQKGTEVTAGSNADLIQDLPKMEGLKIGFGEKSLGLSVPKVAEDGTFDATLGVIPVKGKITANLVVISIPAMTVGDQSFKAQKIDMVFRKEGKEGWSNLDRVQLTQK